MNLHKIVNSITRVIHPNESLIIYKADGQVNNKGTITPIYQAPVVLYGNIQPLDANALKHLEAIGDTQASQQAFLDYPLESTKRIPTPSGGDIIQRSDGTYWLVTSVLEDWNADGWCNVGIVQQVTPPDFSASDWSNANA